MAHSTATMVGRNAEEMVGQLLARAGMPLCDIKGRKMQKESRANWFASSVAEGIRTAQRYGFESGHIAQASVRESIYGNPVKADFVAWGPAFKTGLIVECKTQSTAGSVDEKYPFTIMTMKNVARINSCKSALFLTGGGSRACVINWLKNEQTSDTRFFVEQADFLKWLKSGSNLTAGGQQYVIA